MRKLSGGDEPLPNDAETPPAEAAPVAEAAAQVSGEPVPEWPRSGGCWIRQPDGSLTRDLSEHPEEEA